MLGSERQRLERLTDRTLLAWARRHIAMLEREVRHLDNEIKGQIEAQPMLEPLRSKTGVRVHF